MLLKPVSFMKAKAPAFTPADLTGLTAWLDAESESIGTLATWSDQSGLNNSFSTAAGEGDPEIVDVSGTQFADFAGTGDDAGGSGDLHAGPSWATLFTSLSAWFFAVVYNLDAINASVGDADNFEGDMLFAKGARDLVLNADPNELVLAHWDGSAATLISSGTAQGTGTTRIVMCWQDGTGTDGLAMQVGGAAPQLATASAVDSSPGTGSVLNIGGDSESATWHYLNGKKGALITCSSVPPASERADLVTWAQNTYGAA